MIESPIPGSPPATNGHARPQPPTERSASDYKIIAAIVGGIVLMFLTAFIFMVISVVNGWW